MNLQETIRRILREDTNTSALDSKVITHLNKSIIETINEIDSEIPKTKVNLINRNKIITELKTYLLSIVPQTLNNIKLGKGGDTFVFGVYKKLNEIIDRELNEIGYVKKQSIKLFAPSQVETKKILLNNFDEYYDYFYNGTDFTFWIGWMDETKTYQDNLSKFDNQRMNWLKNNKTKIKNEFVNKMINFLYI